MARKYDGVSAFDIIDSASIVSLAASWTVALWVKAAAPAAGKALWSSGSSGSFPIISLASGTTAGALEYFFFNDAGTNFLTQGSKIALDNTWHHVCWRYDVSTGKMDGWIDAKPDMAPTTLTGTATVTRCSIGVLRTSANQNPFAGSIAKLAMWRSLLPLTGLVDLYSGKLTAKQLNADFYLPLDADPVNDGRLGAAGFIKAGTPIPDPSTMPFQQAPETFGSKL